MGVGALLILLLIVVISALPLHLAVTMLGGRSSILKVIGVSILVAIAVAVINTFFGAFLSMVLGFLALLLIYRAMFEIGFIRAFFAWALQGVIAFLLLALAAFLGLVSLGAALF
ncbi:hypothetical protein KY339_02925 [Candidatus Woesearchaeota archaeon]|nr:hypothetical protein [Candidatus Woesearchaeota archaeon]